MWLSGQKTEMQAYLIDANALNPLLICVKRNVSDAMVTPQSNITIRELFIPKWTSLGLFWFICIKDLLLVTCSCVFEEITN